MRIWGYTADCKLKHIPESEISQLEPNTCEIVCWATSKGVTKGDMNAVHGCANAVVKPTFGNRRKFETGALMVYRIPIISAGSSQLQNQKWNAATSSNVMFILQGQKFCRLPSAMCQRRRGKKLLSNWSNFLWLTRPFSQPTSNSKARVIAAAIWYILLPAQIYVATNWRNGFLKNRMPRDATGSSSRSRPCPVLLALRPADWALLPFEAAICTDNMPPKESIKKH